MSYFEQCMAFDKSLDKELFKKDILFDTTKITVSVFSYNEGTPKMQISRENMGPDGEPRFAKLGRMTKEEAEKVVPAMTEALEHM